MQLADGLGGASAIVLIGAPDGVGTPVAWGTFLLNPALPLVSSPVVPLGGTPGAAGQGNLSILAPVPNSASLAGVTVGLQYLAADPQSSGGASHSAGLVVTICP